MRRIEKHFKYEIFVDDRVVWKGFHPKGQYERIKKKYPKQKIGIAVRPSKGVLIAIQL